MKFFVGEPKTIMTVSPAEKTLPHKKGVLGMTLNGS